MGRPEGLETDTHIPFNGQLWMSHKCIQITIVTVLPLC